MIELNKLAEKIHQNAVDKGFWDKHCETGTLLMLVVSELGEALEAHRKDEFTEDLEGFVWQNDWDKGDISHDSLKFCTYIKDTFEDEIADSIIRLLDICAAKKIDIQKHMELKMKYNSTREKLHGKKY